MIKLSWITDSHNKVSQTAQQDDGLRRAVAYADDNSFDGIVHTGDIGNDSADNCAWAMKILRSGSTPLLWSNGNHSEEESPVGTPSTSDFEAARCWDMSAPFYHTYTMNGDEGETVLFLALDVNIYADDPDNILDSPDHNPGDRVGISGSSPSGDWYRQLGTTQLAWVASTLAADTTSDYIIVLLHYPPNAGKMTDRALLADALQADGRPFFTMSGHVHPDAETRDLTATDATEYEGYKTVGMQNCNGFCDFRVSWNGSIPSVTLAEIHNYSQPDADWEITAPFTVGDMLRVLQFI